MAQRRWGKVLLPLAICVVGAAVWVGIRATAPRVEPRPRATVEPLVRVVRVAPEDVSLVVRAQGTVTPRTESDLVPQVSGPVVWVSPALASGGFFEENEPLVRIDPRDYEVALARARAAVSRTRSEHARAVKERERRQHLRERDVTSASAFDDAVNAEQVAAAALREARAALEQAERDLSRTEIVAPFTGRVREEQVDVGQFVSRGAAVGRIYAVDYAEVRLPVPDVELAFLDLPMLYRGDNKAESGPAVKLRARFAGAEHVWEGRIVRTEGEIDPRSRMVHVVARVDDPYGRAAQSDRPPLAVGLFVEAEIQGHMAEAAVVLPRVALRDANQVLVVNEERRLEFREVEVLRSEGERVIVSSGLAAGERVLVSVLDAVVEGMRVRIQSRSNGTPVAESAP